MSVSNLPRNVRIVEVGPRDGLQNEQGTIAAEDKIQFIDLLSRAGFEMIEATSFVHPKAIPQLADASEVFERIEKRAGCRYPVLVPNARGMERALAAGVREIAVFTAASDTFNRRNINATIDESLVNIDQVMQVARREGVWTRGYISVCFGCPYEGAVDVGRVVEVAARLLDLGIDEVCLGDTIGVAVPLDVDRVLEQVLRVVPTDRLGLHFHDTRGTALANTLRALQLGCWIFDSSAGGLGGCPYAPGAAGNLATEDLLYMLEGMGIETGVGLAAVVAASELMSKCLGKAPASKVFQALAGEQRRAEAASASTNRE